MFNVSTNNIENDSYLNIYPVPSSDYIHVEWLPSNNTNSTSYQIIDLTGKTISSGTLENGITSINIQALMNGLFMIKVNAPNKDYLLKFIKN